MHSICEQIVREQQHIALCGLHGGSLALFLARFQLAAQQTICCVLPNEDQLESLAQDLRLFTAVPVLTYPSFEIPPYTCLNPDPATTAARLATLYALHVGEQPAIVLASVEACLRRVLPRQVLSSHCELVMAGEEIDRNELVTSCISMGYTPSSLVQVPGDLAIRGGIIDLFPPAFANPLRLDFFGDTLESIRLFDPLSQRSEENLSEAVILPASDILFPRSPEALAQWQDKLKERSAALSQGIDICHKIQQQLRFPGSAFFLPLIYPDPAPQSLFEYLPPATPCLVYDPPATQRKIRLLWERIERNYHEAAAEGLALPPKHLFLDEEEFKHGLCRRQRIDLCSLPDPDAPQPPLQQQVGGHGLLQQEIEVERRKRGLLAPLRDRLVHWQAAGDTIILACRSQQQAEHLRDMLAHYGLATGEAPVPLHFALCPPGLVLLVQHPLSQGFDLPEERLHVLSARELFGDKRLGLGQQKLRSRRPVESSSLGDLSPGELAVHRDHGLALFHGLVNMEYLGQRGDFMLLEFHGADKLYVPVDQMHLVTRYQGLKDEQGKLDRLGSQRWQTAKKKVSDAVWQVAHELLDIYARREMQQGHAFQPPGILYQELAESFSYDETEGQAAAIAAVLHDLCSDKPMDRLVCGDVGYGKTEVAVRAACKAIEDGFQVAVLVPTTVLAEQHAATFQERFAGFDMQVACINRFRSPAEYRKILKELKSGQLDLIVGTHRLFSQDLVFHQLGLLIIDEEHRFGVSHKEKIKKLRANIDVLTLTATPIPRTLQMSLLGIRDLSVISTPPRLRRSVKTFLARHDDLVVREAVMQEMARGGQVFFVHNRVQSISQVSEKLQKLVPQARIAVAHGQMPGKILEEVMLRFIQHEVDILVCTTLIESGLDIANANTILISHADKIGLADIYQLRGRVGRSSRQSYAYLLVPSLDRMTPEAEQRLRALMDSVELGSGFKLAMNDLQIRGGGSVLGISQSGHIAALGYDLYLELLQSTVADLKQQHSQGKPPLPEPEIKLRLAAFLPDDYVQDTLIRYRLYRRLSLAGNENPELLADLKEELIDRFGPLPPEGENLIALVGLKYPLRILGITKLEQGPAHLVLSFSEHTPLSPSSLLALIATYQKKPSTKHPKATQEQTMRLSPDQRLILSLSPEENPFTAIGPVLEFLEQSLQ